MYSMLDFCEEQYRIVANGKAEKVRLDNTSALLKPYLGVDYCFADFVDTLKTDVFFGTVKSDSFAKLSSGLQGVEDTELSIVLDGVEKVIVVVAMKHISGQVAKILTDNGFNKCPFLDGATAKEKDFEIKERIKLIDREIESVYQAVSYHADALKNLKIDADYLNFLLEKVRYCETARRTEKTFVLEGFVPSGAEERVVRAVKSVSDAIFTEICEPDKDDNVPTLTRNNGVVRQTEFITDMYSVPHYKEFDPSHTVFFFFTLFMGIIMADIGYGLLMILVGIALAKKIKIDNGAKRLWNIVAIGGFASIIFGFLFNSFFGISVLPFRVLPDPVHGGKDSIMLVLLGCLGLGVIQITVGYVLKAVNCFRNKRIFDGICDGLVWVFFFVGFVFASFNFLLDYLLSDEFVMNDGIRHFFDILTTPALILLLVSLLFAVVTAGRKEKGVGKVTKGFGTLYGLINLMSDILSYARLFGLMLSGMIIAQTFNDIGSGIVAGGGVGIVFGVLVILLGHTFNVAMGVLGAYIHDSRLQYIEYFSKFYTGEGEKFKPFGSDLKYIYITK